MPLTSSIAALESKSKKEAYSARAPISEDGKIDMAKSSVTGDRSAGLFSKDPNAIAKDDFLLLLVTQLRYQDPLSPMDNMQFVSQLAQFKTLEGNLNIEKAIKNLESSYKETAASQRFGAESITNAAAITLIGKQVRLRHSTIQLYGSANEKVPIRVHLGNYQQVNVTLLDEDGKVVRTFRASGKDNLNSTTIVWDGIKDDGTLAKRGTYTIRIEGEESDPSLYAFVQDRVAGVRFTSEGPQVKVGGKEMSIAAIMDVSAADEQLVTSGLSFDSAVALLGKTVRVRSDKVVYNGMPQEKVAINVNLGNREDTEVQILDSSGKVIERLSTFGVESKNGVKTVYWNGSIGSGSSYAAAGEYTIRIVGQEKDPDLYAFTEAVVDGVNTSAQEVRLRAGGRYVPLANIIDVSQSSTQRLEAEV